MDFTELYIKKCKKAEDIQKEWNPDVGDIFSHDGTHWSIVYSNHIDTGKLYTFYNMEGLGYGTKLEEFKNRNYIWLPRQDQLQEIIPLNGFSERNYYWLEEIILGMHQQLKFCCSIEQLWLAFVMKERFRKEWDGEEWK